MNGFFQILRGLGTLRLAIMGGVALGVTGFIIFAASRVATPNMTLLYGGLEQQDSGAIIAKLDQMNIPYDLRAQGAEVFVPADQVLKLRMTLAQDGLPNGGSVGYEIFDRTDNFGTTSFVQNINRVRALEGELARTIRSIDRISSARVHLVLPKREAFSREKREASASIIIKLNGVGRLNEGQIAAIQHIVASAVPDLKPSLVSIADDRGNLLARGVDESNDPTQASHSLEAARRDYEARLKRQIETMLERSAGIGNVRAEVSADIDFDQKTTQSETYDPDSQVVRSTQVIEEESESEEGNGDNTVTVVNNLPEGENAQAGNGNSSANRRSEETVNFEISKTVTTQVREAGVVRRLTVGVLINGTFEEDGKGNRTYKPRDEKELEQLATLVRSSIGYDADRGDIVEVVNMRFAEIESEIEENPAEIPLFLGLNKGDLFRIAELTVLAVVAILALLLVVRPLLSRALTMSPGGGGAARLGGPQAAAFGNDPLRQLPPGVEGMSEHPALGAPGGVTGELESALAHASGGSSTLSQLEEMIDIAQIDGRVKASSLKKVGEIAEKHPEEAVSIIRSWLYQEN